MLAFSENNQGWQEVPSWAEFFIQTGFHWQNSSFQDRKIAIISAPCDSAAAGLICLGALIRDLGNSKANNVDGHYDYLLRHARQYLQNCRKCDLPTCDTDLKSCGYIIRATGQLKSHVLPRVKYTISEKTDFIHGQLALNFSAGRDKTGVQYPSPSNAINWSVKGEPPVELEPAHGRINGDFYSSIIGEANIISDNLKRSWYGVCLAGRVTGKAAARKVFASIRFKNDKNEIGLEDLLTVNGWNPTQSVSRVAYFNSRTEKHEIRTSPPSLVIADGDKSFLKILNREEFQQADVIGVINRVMDRSDLEAVGNQLSTMRQWYAYDFEAMERTPPVPAGIRIMILKRRTV